MLLFQVMAAKQRLEHDTSDLTQKLCRAEQALSAAQAKEADLTRSFQVSNAEYLAELFHKLAICKHFIL